MDCAIPASTGEVTYLEIVTAMSKTAIAFVCAIADAFNLPFEDPRTESHASSYGSGVIKTG
jgi:hypothetical protein